MIFWVKKSSFYIFQKYFLHVKLENMIRVLNNSEYFQNIVVCNQGCYIRKKTIFIFSFCIGLVTQLNGSALGVLKHHYITKRIHEL